MAGKTPSAPGEEKGWKDLLQLDPLEVCRRSLATYDHESRKYTLRVLTVDYDVMLGDRAVMAAGKKDPGIADL
jgi:hypothetical protein